MEVVFINGKRNGYGVEQCGKTLTVRELIEEIEKELAILRTEKYKAKNNIKKFVEIENKISKLEKEYKSII